MRAHTHETVDADHIDPTCPGCQEGLDRLLAALRVDTKGLPDDRLDCLDCGIAIVRAAESGDRAMSMEIELRVRRPLILAAWAPTTVRCEHGTVFFHRPTAAQRRRWREGAL